MSPFAERGALRAVLVERIAADPEFATQLEELYASHVVGLPRQAHWQLLADRLPSDATRNGAPDLAAYVAAVRSLAARWGLDRLIPESEERGARLIHDWCRKRLDSATEIPVAWLVHGLTEAHYVPEIGEVVGRSVVDRRNARIVDELVRPIVRIDVTDEWNPERDLRGSARERLEQAANEQIQRELDRIEADAESKEYTFVDLAPRLDRDLDRLFALMAKRATVEDLMAEASEAEEGVRQSLERIAKRTGVSIRGWRVTQR